MINNASVFPETDGFWIRMELRNLYSLKVGFNLPQIDLIYVYKTIKNE